LVSSISARTPIRKEETMFKPEFVIASNDEVVNGSHMHAIKIAEHDYLPVAYGWGDMLIPLTEKRKDYPYIFHNIPYRINLVELEAFIDGEAVRRKALFPGVI
jgi:hypothetical protein